MKIIRVSNGLGNQMYQYAFILNYKIQKEIIKLDLIAYSKNVEHNGFELQKVFNIKDNILKKEERFRMLGPTFFYQKIDLHFLKIIRSFFKKVLLDQIRFNFFGDYVREAETLKEFCFNEGYLNLDRKNIYFEGWFQSYKYFDHMRDEILQVFTFPEIKKEDKNNFEILQKIKNTESVSLHIRRGDYLRCEKQNICDVSFYKNAFSFIEKKLKNRGTNKNSLQIFIFSNDMDWCRENLDFLKDYKTYYIDWNKKENSCKDMQLMSECKHNIIPNSTFSWWGGVFE